MNYKQKLIAYLKSENKFYLLLLCVSIVGAMVLAVYTPKVQAALIDIASDSTASLPIKTILYTIFISILTVAVISAASVMPSLLMLKYEVGEKLNLVSAIQFLNPRFLSMVGSEGLYYGISNIANDLSFIAYPAFLNIFLSCFQAIIVIYLLSKISILITIPAIVMWGCYILIQCFFSHSQKKYISRARKLIPQMSSALHNVIAQASTISRFGNITAYTGKFKNFLKDYNVTNEKANRLSQMQSSFLTYMKGICFGAFVLIALKDINAGKMTVGHLIMILSYIPILMSPLAKIQYFIKIKAWMNESENNKQELLAECTFPKNIHLQDLTNITREKSLDVKSVFFSYSNEEDD